MKYQFKKILFIEIFLTILALLNFFIIKSTNSLVLILEFLILTILIYSFVGTEKRKSREKKDALLIILITTLAYYLITYFAGFFLGFVYSTYSHSILGIIRNIFVSLVLIYFVETIRECIVKKGQYYKGLVIYAVVTFSLLEIIMQISFGNIHSKIDFLEILLSIIIPISSKNIFLTYCTYHTDKINSMIYQYIMTLPMFLLPVFPNLGDYINTTILTCIPIILMIIVYKTLYAKREKIENSKEYHKLTKIQNIITVFLIILISVTIYLVSDYGRYTVLAIASGSMTDTINKGDVIIIDEKEKEYNVNDVIAFKQNDSVLVHRIVNKFEDDNITYYQTKGDANNAKDPWFIDDDAIIGKSELKVMYIGWPTVWLTELIK